MSIAIGSSTAVPSDSPRVRATPWNSGVSQANAWSAAGSELIGKNVPENRNIGVMPNRKIVVNRFGVFWVAENAAIGPANARPVSTAAGIAKTMSGDSAAPKSTMTSVKIAQIIVSRAVIHARLPSAMSRGVMGVAYIPWKTRLHSRPPMIGNIDSNDADCIAVAGRSPGARNTMYGPPPIAFGFETYEPSPMPIAARNKTGDRNDEKIEARNVRRQERKRCSKTRPMAGPDVERASDVIGAATRSV